MSTLEPLDEPRPEHSAGHAAPAGGCALRLGFHMLRGMSQPQAESIAAARVGGPFASLDDFCRRTGQSRAVATRLAKAGAFDSLGLDRRGALWHALGQKHQLLPLFERLAAESDHEVALPPMSPAQEVLADYRTTGLSLRAHPMKFLRDRLEQEGVVRAEELKTWPQGRPVRVAGIVLVRQRPGTAKGITFVTLEDESGQANLIIRPDVWKRWRAAALGAHILLAHGRLQRVGLVIHVLCTKLEDLSPRLAELTSQSRDFC
jgi:error-prone DNA polymerase